MKGVSSMDDAKIVRLYWERDERAIAETDAKYGPYCTSIAQNILGNPEDAEECVSDTWLGAWNAMPPHRPRMLSTFLGKITRNLSLNRYQHDRAEKRGGGELPAVLEELTEVVSGRDDPQQTLDERELLRVIEGFLDTLSPKKRSIFLCRYWYTDSISQIAAQHGMKEGAVTMTLSRLRQRLQDYLTERGFVL